jgi:hypothetical protein
MRSEELEDMHLVDVKRAKHPTTRIITRKNTSGT